MPWRSRSLFLLLLFSFFLSNCSQPLRSQPAPPHLSSRFWYWNQYAPPVLSAHVPDDLYVHAGTLRDDGPTGAATHRWAAWTELPQLLPPARSYWLVLRDEQPVTPGTDAAPAIARAITELLRTARTRHLAITGVQLDIDFPTASLPQYAALLAQLRKLLPPELQISITALLDWFRPGTGVATLLANVDEFVPQFYDLAPPSDRAAQPAIASPVDPARWGPVFNQFGKRFRLGISTFGRSRFVPATGEIQAFSDLKPMDIALNGGFTQSPATSPAGEFVVSWKAARRLSVGYRDFEPGDVVQFILPTAQAIGAAVAGARQMGANCAGILFFRWPASNEDLAMPPDSVMAAAGFAPPSPQATRIQAVDRHCAAVTCVDLYLTGLLPTELKVTHFLIRSSVEFQYFLPAEKMPTRMRGPAVLSLDLPPVTGENRILLGRAVTAAPAAFTLETRP